MWAIANQSEPCAYGQTVIRSVAILLLFISAFQSESTLFVRRFVEGYSIRIMSIESGSRFGEDFRSCQPPGPITR
jgi:hypothetical protein